MTNFGGSDHKESACHAGDADSIPGLGRFPGEVNGNPLQYSCLENSHGQRSLAGYIVHGGHKESNTTERLTLSLLLLKKYMHVYTHRQTYAHTK